MDQRQGCWEKFLRSIGVAHQEGGVLADQGHGIVGLVVFGHVGGRDKHRCLAHGAELGNRAGTAAGDYHIGSRIGKVHAGDEVKVADALDLRVGGHEFVR